LNIGLITPLITLFIAIIANIAMVIIGVKIGLSTDFIHNYINGFNLIHVLFIIITFITVYNFGYVIDKALIISYIYISSVILATLVVINKNGEMKDKDLQKFQQLKK